MGPGGPHRPAMPPRPPRRSNSSGVVIGVLVLGLALAGTMVRLFGGESSDHQARQTTTMRTTQRPTTQPVTTEPQTTEPTTTEPTTTEPATTQTTTTQQQSTEQQTTEPPPSEPLPRRSWGTLPPPHSNAQPWRILQTNSIYGYDIPMMKCPSVLAKFTSDAQYRSYINNTIQCQWRGWKTVFDKAGEDLPKPKVLFISGAVQSPCGRAGAEVSFYCGSWDGSNYTMYMHTNLAKQSNEWWRLRAFETSAHEFGHHVQMMSGVMYQSAVLADQGTIPSDEASRRRELQTSCWAMRLTYQTPVTKFSREDYDVIVEWSAQDQDSEHGSAESNTYWWQRGLYMKKVGGCNTWTVGAKYVS